MFHLLASAYGVSPLETERWTMRTCLRMASRVSAEAWGKQAMEMARAGVKLEEMPKRPVFSHEILDNDPRLSPSVGSGAGPGPGAGPGAGSGAGPSAGESRMPSGEEKTSEEKVLEALKSKIQNREMRFEAATLEGLRSVLGGDAVGG